MEVVNRADSKFSFQVELAVKFGKTLVITHGHHRSFDQEWEMVNVTNGTMFGGLNLKPSESFKDADWGKYLLILHLFVTLWGNAFIQ